MNTIRHSIKILTLFMLLGCAKNTSAVFLEHHLQDTTIPLQTYFSSQTFSFDKPYALFLFPKNTSVFDNTIPSSLQVTIERIEPLTNEANLYLAFVYDTDFTFWGTVKSKWSARPVAFCTLNHAKNVQLSLEYDSNNGKPRGFVVFCPQPAKLSAVQIQKTRWGWNYADNTLFLGIGKNGGKINDNFLETHKISQLDFTDFGIPKDNLTPFFDIRVFLDTVTYAPQTNNAPLQLTLNDVAFSIRTPRQKKADTVTLNSAFFNNSLPILTLPKGINGIRGMTISKHNVPALSPIPADPYFVLHWQQENWRQKEFELFSWESFPSVLIMDFDTYKTQSAFFKRLAFFVEKKGTVGMLLTNKDLQDMHGFNAHDYSAESLARFFTLAKQQSFTLNSEEYMLRDILLYNNIIVQEKEHYRANNGAVISLSRQSNYVLRKLFITHEGLHGIFFTHADFRDTVNQVFQNTDERARQFLMRYFEAYPSLNYNTADDYLIKNEFMAYILQQELQSVPYYFAQILARRNPIRRIEPELSDYVIATNAIDFKKAATELNEFLKKEYGLAGGNIFLTTYSQK